MEQVVRLLENSHADLTRALEGLSDDFCLQRPFADRWSITEVLEHLVMIEERVPRMLQLKLPERALSASDTSYVPWNDAQLVEQIISYTAKVDAPDFLRPTGRYGSCRQALNELSAAREHTLAYARSAPTYLRGRLLPHPLFGPLDGWQWLLALGAHTQRHTKQVNAIKISLQEPPHCR